MLAPSSEQRSALARLVRERHAIPARLDLEPLVLPGGPPLGELLDGVRGDRL